MAPTVTLSYMNTDDPFAIFSRPPPNEQPSEREKRFVRTHLVFSAVFSYQFHPISGSGGSRPNDSPASSSTRKSPARQRHAQSFSARARSSDCCCSVSLVRRPPSPCAHSFGAFIRPGRVRQIDPPQKLSDNLRPALARRRTLGVARRRLSQRCATSHSFLF